MPLDWNSPLQTSHGQPRQARLRDGQGPGGQRRVAIIGDYALSHEMGRGAYVGDFERGDWPTIFLFNEQGRCSTTGQPSQFDLVNS